MKPLRASDVTNAEPFVGRGHRSVTTLAAISERDRLLRAAAKLHRIGMSDRQAAAMLRTKLGRYRAGAWRRTRADLTGRHPADRLEAWAWAILKNRDVLVSERSIRAALSRTTSE